METKLTYEVLEAFSANDLANKVNVYLSKGWVMYGYPSVVRNEKHDHTNFYQAMVTELKKD